MLSNSLSLIFSLGFILAICFVSTLAIDVSSSSEESSSSSTTTTLPTISTNTQPKSASSQPSASKPVVNNNSNKAWPMHSGPINYYQFAHSPSYNYRSPLPSTQSSSLSSLMSNLFSPFNKVMSRRAGGKLFSLADQFNPSPNNALNPLSGLEYSGSVGSLEALNDAVNNVMMGLNGMAPNQANQLAGQLGSYLSMVGGAPIDASSKNGKKLLDIPKQWYKLLGEKLSGASEAAYSATVPLKESFMSTLKSFYSYIKPSRSQSASPFADATNMVAAAAAAAAGAQDSLGLTGTNSITAQSNNQNNNPKRRQSDSYAGYYYNNGNNNNNNMNGKMMAQPHQHQQQAHHHHHQQQQHGQQSQYPIGARYHGSVAYHQKQQQQQQHHPQQQQQAQHGFSGKQQPQQQQRSMTKMNQQVSQQQQQAAVQQSQEMLGLESQAHASIAKQQYFGQPAKQQNGQNEMMKYDQMLTHMIQAQVQQGQSQFMGAASTTSNPTKHPNALYQKSKEIFSRFTKKNRGQQPQYGYNTFPLMTEYPNPHQTTYQRLPSQTIAKVSNKLATLPLVYNHQQQQQQQIKSQHQHQQSQQTQQSSKSQQQPQPQQSKNHLSFFTQQPLNQNPFGIQPVYPPQPQSSGTTSISSTSSPMSTSTSVSMSMSGGQQQQQQQSQSQYDQYEEPQHLQYNHHHQQDMDAQNEQDGQQQNDQQQQQAPMPSVSSSSQAQQISVQNNQGSVMYYYEQPQAHHQPQTQQDQNTGSQDTLQDMVNEQDSNKKK